MAGMASRAAWNALGAKDEFMTLERSAFVLDVRGEWWGRGVYAVIGRWSTVVGASPGTPRPKK